MEKCNDIISNDDDMKWIIDNQSDDNKYIVVRGLCTEEDENFEWLHRVNALLKYGYKPIGGVAFSKIPDEYHQAMIRN